MNSSSILEACQLAHLPIGQSLLADRLTFDVTGERYTHIMFDPSAAPVSASISEPPEGGGLLEPHERSVWQSLITVVTVIVVGFLSMAVAATLMPDTETMSGAELLLAAFEFGAGATCGVAMVWRKTKPVTVMWLTVALAIIFPVGPFAALGALTWVIPVSVRRRAVMFTALVTIACTRFVIVDSLQDNEHSFLTIIDDKTGAASRPNALGYIAIMLLLLACAVAIGTYRNQRVHAIAQVAAHKQAVVDQTRVTQRLQGELSRQQERELIAREMHDTVAHQLSLVALQAGALEVTTQDPNVPDAARNIRATTQKALDEMRGLIGSLRDSQDGGYTGHHPGLDQLESLLVQAKDAGALVDSELHISEPELASPSLTSAVYRITQESITNALRYGTGAMSVRLLGAPGLGISIDVINEVSEEPRAVQGSGSGLPGMAQRAELLGGTVTTEQIGGVWIMRARLPWEKEQHQ